MEEQSLQKLEKIIAITQEGTVDRTEVTEVFELFLGLLRKLKEDTDTQAQAIYAELDSKINTIKSLSDKNVTDSEHKLDNKIAKAFSDANETVIEAKAYLADRITDVKRSIPEQKEFDPSPTYIKEKLLQAGLTTKDIKGTEALVDKSTLETAIVEIGGKLQVIEKRNSKGYGALGGGSEGTGSLFLSRLRDVDVTGLTMLNGKYQLGIGSSSSSISLTTTGSSGPATLVGNVLNIPVYSGGGTPGGLNTQLQRNDNGTFGGISRITSNGTNLFFTGESSPAYAAGKLVYDTDNESLTFFNNEAMVSMQVGQEEWIRVINNTGSTIANGAAVYISGAASGLLQVTLARSNAPATTIGAGLATQSIANGAIGYVTVIGVVRGLDTSAFTAGQTVYISSTVAGALTATAPLAPNYRYRIGIVGVSSSTVGTIHVTPSTASLGNGTANQVFGMNAAGTAQEVKSLAGTANRLTVTHTANTITYDISTAYVGQTSITTLGTIGTGTWQGTLIAGQYGGTGVANTGKTITLGGNLTTSGAFATTITSTATTSVTLPVTGTLATLAGAEALTNKSVNGVTLTTGGGTTTFLNANGTYTTPAGGGTGTVTSVATNATLTGGPITTTGTLGLNLANANTWTANQTFNAGTLLDKGEIVTDVKAYGAKGDGTTDDTSAINLAIAAGGTTFFPAGTYIHTGLTMLSGTYLKGVGTGNYANPSSASQRSILKLKNSSNTHSVLIPDGISYGTIESIEIDGNKANQSSGMGINMADGAAKQESAWRILNVEVYNAYGNGVYIGSNRQAIYANLLRIIGSGQHGLQVNGSDGTFIKTLTGANGFQGTVMGGYVNRFIGGESWSNSLNGIVINGTMISAYGMGIDRNQNNGIEIASGANDVSVQGSQFHSNGQAADNTYSDIAVTTTGLFSITGNSFAGLDSGITFKRKYAINTNGNNVTQTANNHDSSGTGTGFTDSGAMASLMLQTGTFLKSGANVLLGGNGFNTLLRPDSSGGEIQLQSFAGSTNLLLSDGGGLTLSSLTTGLVKSSSGLLSNATAGTDYVTPTGNETISNKTLTSPKITSSVSSAVGSIERDSSAFYSTTVASSRGVIPSQMFALIDSDFALGNIATAQNAFPAAYDTWTLSPSTTYKFEGIYYMATGTTAHALLMGFLLGGSATVTSMSYHAIGSNAQANANTSIQGSSWVNTVTQTTVLPSAANSGSVVQFTGYIRMGAGVGTVTPQIQYSAAPGGTNVMKANSYITFTAVGTDTVTAVGNVA